MLGLFFACQSAFFFLLPPKMHKIPHVDVEVRWPEGQQMYLLCLQARERCSWSQLSIMKFERKSAIVGHTEKTCTYGTKRHKCRNTALILCTKPNLMESGPLLMGLAGWAVAVIQIWRIGEVRGDNRDRGSCCLVGRPLILLLPRSLHVSTRESSSPAVKCMWPLKLKQSARARFAPLDPQSFTFDKYGNTLDEWNMQAIPSY